MKKQIRLSELMGALSRNGLGHFPSYEIEELKREVKNSENSLLLEYIPVKLVASLEEGFRQQYKSIIDSPFYRKNLKDVKYLKDTKFDFEVISAFEDNEITLGDYISYLLPCNNVQNIISNLNELLGVEFINKLQEFLSLEIELTDIKDQNEMFNWLDYLFKTRHIICHEAYRPSDLTNDNAIKMIESASAFLIASERYISKKLYSPDYLSTPELQLLSSVMFEKYENELNDIIEKLSEWGKECDPPISFDYMNSWHEYREEKAICEASSFEGGTGYSYVYLNSLAETTKQKIKELKSEYRMFFYRDTNKQ
jgi:hypothetical protein